MVVDLSVKNLHLPERVHPVIIQNRGLLNTCIKKIPPVYFGVLFLFGELFPLLFPFTGLLFELFFSVTGFAGSPEVAPDDSAVSAGAPWSIVASGSSLTASAGLDGANSSEVASDGSAVSEGNDESTSRSRLFLRIVSAETNPSNSHNTSRSAFSRER